MKEIKVINGKMTSKDFAELTGTELRSVHVKVKKLLTDLEFKIDDPNLDHEEFQILRDNRGYISQINLNRDLSLTLAGQYEPKIAYHVAKAFNKPQLQLTRRELALMVIEAEDKIEMLLRELKNAHPMITFTTTTEQSFTMLEVTKILNTSLPGCDFGRTGLFGLLRNRKVLMEGRNSRDHNLPMRRYEKYFPVVVMENDYGVITVTRVNKAGVKFIGEHLQGWMEDIGSTS